VRPVGDQRQLLRSVPRPGDFSDPRRAGQDDRLRRPDSALAGRPEGREIRQFARDAAFPEERTSVRSERGPRRLAKTREIVVVEGYTDTIMAHQVGVGNVVAVLGTALGENHIRLLKRFADRITLVLDGDEAGQRRTNEILELFVAAQVDSADPDAARATGSLRFPAAAGR
jgi:5S rRNA maturation endonuclease (ribonuclease M5)